MQIFYEQFFFFFKKGYKPDPENDGRQYLPHHQNLIQPQPRSEFPNELWIQHDYVNNNNNTSGHHTGKGYLKL